MPVQYERDRRDRPTQDPKEGRTSPPKPEPEPAIPEGQCKLHPTQHKAKDCPALLNTARFSGYLGPASEGDAQPGVVPLGRLPREDPLGGKEFRRTFCFAYTLGLLPCLCKCKKSYTYNLIYYRPNWPGQFDNIPFAFL